MTRLALFGPHGQVGAEIRRRAPARGVEIRALPRSLCDLETPGAAADAILRMRPDAVVNAAAYTAVDRAESEPARAARINAEAAGEIAAAAAETGVPLVHFSTDYVFDGESCRPYLEEDEAAPLSVYGATKYDGERRVAAAGGVHAVLRLSWVFSGHGPNFVRTMLRLGREKGAVRVVDDQRGRPTFAGDAAEAALDVVAGLCAAPERSGVYHFAGAETVSWADFAEEIFRAARLGVELARIPGSAYPAPARRPSYSVLDTTKILKTFGVAAPSHGPGLAAAIAELQAAAEKGAAK